MLKNKTFIVAFCLLTTAFLHITATENRDTSQTPMANLPSMPTTGLSALSPIHGAPAWGWTQRFLSWPPGAQNTIVAPAKVEPPSADFRAFVRQVSGGARSLVSGVYVEDVLAFPVVQQPADNPAYVSEKTDVVTQFSSASHNGITGLLAHNYLAGEIFYQVEEQDTVRVVYGSGRYRTYQVTDIQQYQKLSPGSLQSALIDLSSGEKLTTAQVFARVYRGEHHLTMQTCLEKDGLANWGLTFIVAKPVD